MFRFMRGGSNVFEKDDVSMDEVLNDDSVQYSMDSPNDKCKEL